MFVFTMLPLVLAHAGLSTTDTGLTAFFAAASYRLVLCVSEPGWRNGALFGVLLGGMALSKFSGFAYLPAAAAVSAAVVWTEYLFSFGKSGWFSFPVPFPELFSGIDQMKKHNAEGHLTHLLGDLSMKGWWLFFPLLILVKAPVAALLAAGAGRGVKRPSEGAWPGWLPWAVMGAILAVAMSARTNIGLRHLLPGFVFLAVSPGSGLLSLLERAAARRWADPAAGVLAAWLVLTGAAAHPDYLPYFNGLAGEHPENIVVDSDLDCGQDMKRLGQRLLELNAPHVTFTNHVPANLDAFGFPSRQHSDAEQPAPGWSAVSLTEWKLYRFGLQLQNPEVKLWPDEVKPSEMMGKTILLYYFSPAGGGR